MGWRWRWRRRTDAVGGGEAGRGRWQTQQWGFRIGERGAARGGHCYIFLRAKRTTTWPGARAAAGPAGHWRGAEGCGRGRSLVWPRAGVAHGQGASGAALLARPPAAWAGRRRHERASAASTDGHWPGASSSRPPRRAVTLSAKLHPFSLAPAHGALQRRRAGDRSGFRADAACAGARRRRADACPLARATSAPRTGPTLAWWRLGHSAPDLARHWAAAAELGPVARTLTLPLWPYRGHELAARVAPRGSACLEACRGEAIHSRASSPPPGPQSPTLGLPSRGRRAARSQGATKRKSRCGEAGDARGPRTAQRCQRGRGAPTGAEKMLPGAHSQPAGLVRDAAWDA